MNWPDRLGVLHFRLYQERLAALGQQYPDIYDFSSIIEERLAANPLLGVLQPRGGLRHYTAASPPAIPSMLFVYGHTARCLSMLTIINVGP